jgi:hypothetical protein
MTFYDDNRNRLPDGALCTFCSASAYMGGAYKLGNDGFMDRPAWQPLCRACCNEVAEAVTDVRNRRRSAQRSASVV